MKKRILSTLKAHLLLNEEVLSPAEIQDLKEQINHVQKEIWAEESKKHVAQLKAFSQHLSDMIEKYIGDDLDDTSARDMFYNSNFTISFMGKSVEVYNGADVFQSIEEIIDFEIQEYKED